MSTRDKLIIALSCIAIVVLLFLIGATLNPAGFWKFWDEVGNELLLAFRILFIVALTLLIGGAGFLVLKWVLSDRHVIRPGKQGPAQAVIHQGKVVQLTTVDLPPGQQLALLKQALQISGTAVTMTKRLSPYMAEGEEDTVESGNQKQLPERASSQDRSHLPSFVRYEDIAPQIPQDHALVGVDERGVVTRERAVKALIWIVGGSGSGKTNSACLRIEEDYLWGHWFLVIDPHWFKPDSLWNAIKGYQDRFIVPIKGMEHPFASETPEIIAWLEHFIEEFKRRKKGGAWKFPITLVIEEIGSLVSDKTEDRQELYMRELIKTATRICGQEGRNFETTGMCISQDAAGLAWLRKRAVMVIAHKLVMMSERELACNENTVIAREMDEWPKGRALIYGIEFQGQRVYQQPVKKPRIVESVPPHQPREQQAEHTYRQTDPALPRVASRDFQATEQRKVEEVREVNGEAGGRNGSEKGEITDLSVVKELREIGKRLKKGEEKTAIVKSYGLPWGRGTQELSEVVDFVEQQLKEAGEL